MLSRSTRRHSQTRSHDGRSRSGTTSWTIRCSPSTRSRISPTVCRRNPCGASAATCRSRTTAATSTSGTARRRQTIKDVERNGVRISLRDIHQAPEYAELINECLDEVEELVADREGGMTRRAGYLFITAPASTTPMHFDVEHSFLLQIRGVKHVSVAAFEDDPAALQREFDRYVDGRECDFEAMQAVAEEFVIEPGVGVYLPSYVPHWVETEAGISISFSIPFHTEYVERAEAVSRINKRLRRIHLSPRPAGASESVDKTKQAVIRSWLKLQEARNKLPT